MMPFAEKLTFLMHICQTGNKDLAQELGVDPSMVSLMRTGKRRLSKDPAMAEKMGLFFARRCSAPFQRQALAETLGQLSISPSMPTARLAAILSGWLRGEGSTLADSILSAIEEPPAPVTEPAELPVPSPGILADEGRTTFFFGVEGRQESFAKVIQACRQLTVPGTILIVVDDNLEWLLHDYALSRKTQAQLLELVERGFAIRQIVPPPTTSTATPTPCSSGCPCTPRERPGPITTPGSGATCTATPSWWCRAAASSTPPPWA